VHRPSDGQKFILQTDPYNSDEFMWDDALQQWFRIAHNAKVKISKPIDFIPITIHIGNLDSLKCECGSEKVGSNKHSSWCKKFDPKV
jgi:hypothetical protein